MKKKILCGIIATIVPMCIIILCFLLKNIYPFGDFSPRIYDAYYQYTGFFLGLKDFSLYSFKSGLGFNFYATATYYLFSPVNILLLFGNIKNIDFIFALIIFIKIGLSSLCMYILLNTHSNKGSVIFSIIYALSGFITSYYYNIMWLDAIYMLPIVIMGIDKLFQHKNFLYYTIPLALTIIFNFYTGYMVCIFSLLYFIFKYINTDKNKRKGLIKAFVISSLLAGLLSSFVLIPACFGLLQGKASGYGSDYTNYFQFNPNIQYFFNKLTPSSFYNGDQRNGPMQIYSSLFAVVYFVLTLFNTKKDKKYKISLLVFLGIFILSFSFNLFDYAWEFFQRPVWWNNRYSFIFSFFIIYFAYQNYIDKDNIKLSNYHLTITIIILFGCFITSFLLRYISITNTQTKILMIILIAVSLLFILSYLLLFNIEHYRYYIYAAIIVELCLNCFTSVSANLSNKDMKTIRIYDDSALKAVTYLDNNNYNRSEFVNRHLYNDGFNYQYNGINYFNSVRNQNYVNFSEYKLNFKVDSHCSTVINYFDPILMSMLNVKYIIGSDITYFDLISDNNSHGVYKNNNTLGIGFMVNSESKKIKLQNHEHLNNIEVLINEMNNSKIKLYHSINLDDLDISVKNGNYQNGKIINYNQKENVVVNIKFTSDGHYFIAPTNPKPFKDYTNVIVNETRYISNGSYIEINKGDQVTICISYDEKLWDLNDFLFKLLDIKDMETILSNLKKHSLIVDNNTKHLIEGKVNVLDNKTLFFSIPYEKGFIIKVDGKKVNYDKYLDTFISIDLNKGEHEIIVDYIPNGLMPGVIISSVSLVITLLLSKKKML